MKKLEIIFKDIILLCIDTQLTQFSKQEVRVMKFVIILIFILSNQIATANTVTSTIGMAKDVTSARCSQAITDLSQNNVNDSTELVKTKNKKHLVDTLGRAVFIGSLPITVPVSAAITVGMLPFMIAYQIIKGIYNQTKILPEYLREKRADRLRRRLEKLTEEMELLEADWGLSTESVVQLTMKKYHTPTKIHNRLSSISKAMGFSKEEIGKIAQSVRDFIMLDVDLLRLFEQGFTRDQIIQIVELGIIAEYRDRVFKREANSVASKKKILRQAGFNKEEINRIPAEIFKKDKTRILLNYLDFILPSSGLVLSSDLVYWWITDNSFIW